MPPKSNLSVPDEILTIRDVAGLQKLADKTVYAMENTEESLAFKVRDQWPLRQADVKRWV